MRKTHTLVKTVTTVIGIASLCAAVGVRGADLPLIDSHIHYSHDAWENLPPPAAVEVLRKAGLKRAFVSSSSDEGTQKLFSEAPDLIVPVLRPYRQRGETGSWVNDLTVLDMLSERIANYSYAGIGEFHAFGEQVELPVLQGVIDLAKQHRLFLHAHSDADAVNRIFARDPQAVVLWAHSGFDGPALVDEMLSAHPNLWSDLAFRSEHYMGDTVDPVWQALFEKFPDRFMLGTDTYAPERWFYVVDHAQSSRQWLKSLPEDLRENIAWRNAERLLAAVNPISAKSSVGKASNACAVVQDKDALCDNGYCVVYSTQPASPRVGDPFDVAFNLCRDGKTVDTRALVDATMPAHGHGMNYAPDMSQNADGSWLARGMLWHMPGEWELRFRFDLDGSRMTMAQPVRLLR